MAIHYIKIKKRLDSRIFEKISILCRYLSENEEFLGIIADWDGYGSPTFSSSQICFNGTKEDIADTFLIRSDSEIDTILCDTKNKPYDMFVRCCLIIIKYHFEDDVYIDSDDRDDYLWGEANIIVNDLLDTDDIFVLDRVVC